MASFCAPVFGLGLAFGLVLLGVADSVTLVGNGVAGIAIWGGETGTESRAGTPAS